jgi:hypothetical protein
MPTKITWVAEKEVWLDDEEKKLFEALAKTGSDVIPFTLGKTLLNEEVRKIQGPVIGRGSIQFIKRSTSGLPWAWVSWPEFRCSYYYVHFSDVLLQEEFLFMPWGLLQSRKFLFDTYGEDGSLFIRPDSNDKVFSGRVVRKEKFDDWYKMENDCYSPSKELQCVVSKPRKIHQEIRFIGHIGSSTILGSSSYNEGTKKELSIPKEAKDFCHLIMNRLCSKPDILGYTPIVVIDVAMTDQGPRLCEFGCVNCCSWYGCDPEPIVRSMEQEAKEDYEKD